MNEKITSIRVRESTRAKIASLGTADDSMEDIVLMLIQCYEESITGN